MALLIGSEATQATSITVTKETAEACQFTAAATGTVSSISFRTSGTANTGLTKWQVAIFAEGAGKPGALIAKSAIQSSTPGINALITATLEGAGASVVSGTKYWLALLPIDASIHLLGKAEGEKTVLQATPALLELKETTWGATTTKGPLSTFGSSIVGGAGAASAALAATPASRREASGTGSASLGAETAFRGAAQQQRGPGKASLGAEGTVAGSRATSGVSRVSTAIEATSAGETPPVLIIGSEEEPPSPTLGLGLVAGRPLAFQFVARKTGKVASVSMMNGVANTATSLSAAILTDVAGTPGSLVGPEGTLTATGEHLPSESLLVVPGLAASLVEGNTYWIVLLGLGGTMKLKATKPELAHSPSRRSASSTASIASLVGGWEADTSNGPIRTFGLGHLSPQGKPTVSLGAEVSEQGARAVGGTSAAQLAGEVHAEGEVIGGGRGRGKVRLGAETATPQGTRAATGVGHVSAGLDVEATGVSGAVKKNVKYGPQPQQFLDVYPSANFPAATAPVIVFMHPGGWVSEGEKEKFTPIAEAMVRGEPGGAFAHKSCCCFNIEYHEATATSRSWPQSVEDCILAVEWALAHAAEYGGDPNKLFIIGASAGAQMAFLAAEALGGAVKGAVGLSVAGADLQGLAEENELLTNPFSYENEPFVTHLQEALGETIVFRFAVQTTAGSKVLKGVPTWLVQNTIVKRTTVSGPGIVGEPKVTKYPGTAKGTEVEIETAATETGTVTLAFACNAAEPPGEPTTTGASRVFQHEWSPARKLGLGTWKALIFSSRYELVSPAQSQRLQEHLEAEGKWDYRSFRYLRTDEPSKTNANNFIEVQEGGLEGLGHGHALTYWSNVKPIVTSFIFAPDAGARASGGLSVKATGKRSVSGAVSVTAALRVSHVGGHAITGSATLGGKVAHVGGFQHLGEGGVTLAARVASTATRSTHGIGDVRMALGVAAGGTTRFRSKAFVSMGAVVQTASVRVIDHPSGTPPGGRVAVPQRGRMT